MIRAGDKTITSLEKDCAGDCVQGYRYEKNTVSLLTFLVPGDYRLALFYTQMTRIESQWLATTLVYLPYTFNIFMEPLFETEDRFNCKAARLPHFLNIPGLLDSETFLNYRERVMLDLQGVTQSVSYSLSKAAVVRVVTTEPDGIDIEMSIMSADGSHLGSSNSIGGTEGLTLHLNAGQYILQIVYSNSVVKRPEKLFCATYLLEIGIRPQSSVQDFTAFYKLANCYDSSAAIDTALSSMEDSLKASKDASFILSPQKSGIFVLPSNPNQGETLLYSYEFEVIRSTYVNFGRV